MENIINKIVNENSMSDTIINLLIVAGVLMSIMCVFYTIKSMFEKNFQSVFYGLSVTSLLGFVNLYNNERKIFPIEYQDKYIIVVFALFLLFSIISFFKILTEKPDIQTGIIKKTVENGVVTETVIDQNNYENKFKKAKAVNSILTFIRNIACIATIIPNLCEFFVKIFLKIDSKLCTIKIENAYISQMSVVAIVLVIAIALPLIINGIIGSILNKLYKNPKVM